MATRSPNSTSRPSHGSEPRMRPCVIDKEKYLLIHGLLQLAFGDDFPFRAISQAACALDCFLLHRDLPCGTRRGSHSPRRPGQSRGPEDLPGCPAADISTSTPFQIVVDDAIHYRFDNPSQELVLELGEDSSSLSERSSGTAAPVRPARYDDSVRGTGISI